MGHQIGVTAGKEDRYYIKLGRAADCLLRCKDCQALVTQAHIQQYACCDCGNRRFAEIVTLTDAEQAEVQSMDFPYKAEFLAEFRPRE